MSYSSTVTAIMGLNLAHDGLILKLSTVNCPTKKLTYEHEELRIMSCLLELLDSLPGQEKDQILQLIESSALRPVELF